MRKYDWEFYFTIAFCIVIIIVCSYSIVASNESAWNGGYCDKCGGRWIFVNASSSNRSDKYIHTYYHYACENCGKVISTTDPMERESN